MSTRPTMALTLPHQHIEPGGTVIGKLRTFGGSEPLVIDRLRARLLVRVYSLFDDDDGSPPVWLFDGTIGEDIHLGAQATVKTELRLSVPWSAPVTRSNGKRLRGLSVTVETWGEGAVPVVGVMRWIEVDPLPWQQRLLAACERSGLRWKTNLAYPGSQEIKSYLPRRIRREVTLTWRVRQHWVTVELYGHPRPPFSLRLTHAQATRTDWADELSSWLATPANTN